MFSFQIEHFLSGNPYFLGCFPKNKLPPMPTSFPKTIIVNTQDSNQPGEHWLALVLMKNKCFYFDSFGLGVIEYEIKEYLKCKYNNVTYSDKCIQHITSNKCGEFCILFVKFVKNKKSYINFLSYFDVYNLKMNDDIVKYLLYYK